MNFKEFSIKIQQKYPPNKRQLDIKDFLPDWIRAIDLNGNYDYDGAFLELMRTYGYNKLPEAADVVKILREFRKEDENSAKQEFIMPPSIWAYHESHKSWYEFVQPPDGWTAAVKGLEKKGFVKFSPKKPERKTA